MSEIVINTYSDKKGTFVEVPASLVVELGLRESMTFSFMDDAGSSMYLSLDPVDWHSFGLENSLRQNIDKQDTDFLGVDNDDFFGASDFEVLQIALEYGDVDFDINHIEVDPDNVEASRQKFMHESLSDLMSGNEPPSPDDLQARLRSASDIFDKYYQHDSSVVRDMNPLLHIGESVLLREEANLVPVTVQSVKSVLNDKGVDETIVLKDEAGEQFTVKATEVSDMIIVPDVMALNGRDFRANYNPAMKM